MFETNGEFDLNTTTFPLASASQRSFLASWMK